MMNIPGSQYCSFAQLIFAAVYMPMLFLIPSPCEGQLSVIYSTFFKEFGIIIWAFTLRQEAMKPANCPDRK